jgi:hypothetical protein
MTTDHHTQIAAGAALDAVTFNNPLGQLDAAITAYNTGAGTTFPSTPSAGQFYFRTDLGLWCYWNGTYWLMVNEYPVYLARVTGQSTTASVAATAVSQTWRPYITRCALNIIVATTNTGSAYWKIHFRGMNQADSSGDDLYTPSTAAIAADTYTHFNSAVNRISTVNPVARFDWYAEKVGTPGNAQFEAVLNFRFVIP